MMQPGDDAGQDTAADGYLRVESAACTFTNPCGVCPVWAEREARRVRAPKFVQIAARDGGRVGRPAALFALDREGHVWVYDDGPVGEAAWIPLSRKARLG